jgi:hypothetical protein
MINEFNSIKKEVKEKIDEIYFLFGDRIKRIEEFSPERE